MNRKLTIFFFSNFYANWDFWIIFDVSQEYCNEMILEKSIKSFFLLFYRVTIDFLRCFNDAAQWFGIVKCYFTFNFPFKYSHWFDKLMVNILSISFGNIWHKICLDFRHFSQWNNFTKKPFFFFYFTDGHKTRTFRIQKSFSNGEIVWQLFSFNPTMRCEILLPDVKIKFIRIVHQIHHKRRIFRW